MKPLFHLSVLCCCGWILYFDTVYLEASHWPGFRGPQENGIAEKEQPPINFGPSSNVLWKVDLAGGHASPILWQDQIYITGETGTKLNTLSLDRLTGQKRWEQSITVPKLEPVHRVNSHASSTPVTDGKAVYVYFGSFGLLAYDMTGKELWRKPLPMPKTFFNQGTSTSPILADGKLIVFVQIGENSHLLALNPSDGKELWQAPLPNLNYSWSTPVSWSESGKAMVGFTCSTRFTAFQLSDGQEAWWLDSLGYEACSTPVVTGDRIILSTAGVQGGVANVTPPPAFEEMIKQYDQDKDGLLAYEEIPEQLLFTDRQISNRQGDMPVRQALSMFGGVKKGAKLNRDQWETIRSRLIQFGTGDMNRSVVVCARTGGKQAAQSQVLWKETKGVPEVPSPLVWQGRLYLIRSGGILVCRNMEDGKLIYENRTGSRGGYFASPVLADGRLYLASDRGTVTVVKAGDNFEVLARNELEDPIMASPVVVDNTLYIRSASKLWAFKGR